MKNLFDLTGKVAIVTGGNGGIGLGIARGLAQVGAKVAIVGRNADKSQAAARALAEETGRETLALTADVSRPEEVESVIKNTTGRLGRLAILFNNPGLNIPRPPPHITSALRHTVPHGNLT